MSTPLENNTAKLQELKELVDSLPSKLIITDDVTGEKYIIGITEGKLYYKLESSGETINEVTN